MPHTRAVPPPPGLVLRLLCSSAQPTLDETLGSEITSASVQVLKLLPL